MDLEREENRVVSGKGRWKELHEHRKIRKKAATAKWTYLKD